MKARIAWKICAGAGLVGVVDDFGPDWTSSRLRPTPPETPASGPIGPLTERTQFGRTSAILRRQDLRDPDAADLPAVDLDRQVVADPDDRLDPVRGPAPLAVGLR